MLRLFNTLSRKKELFVPLKKNIVTLYSCGPTVYHNVHIGNHRTFITTDILRRSLSFLGYRVLHIMNITDVGHLVSDADDGEDKMEIGATREKKSAYEIARRYERIFREEHRALGCEPPKKWTRATAHIKEQIALIKKLERRGVTYRTDDGIYFDSSRCAGYGALTGAVKHRTGQRAGARIDVGGKKHPTDFALWKFSPTDVKRQMEWESPWGVGFPGWHIECSAMAMAYLGSTIDIHTGGTDLIPIHHTNEIAQSETATGKPFVRYWVHGAFVLEHDKKMSKSSGEFKTVAWIRDNWFEPLDYRYLTLQTHYRKELHFSKKALEAAARARRQLCVIVTNAPRGGKILIAWIEKFRAALEDDINTPQALSVAWRLAKSDENPSNIRTTLLAMDKVFQVGLEAARKSPSSAQTKKPSAAVRSLLKQRADARAAKQWEISDSIRMQIQKQGFDVIDTPDGKQTLSASHDTM